VGRAGLGGHRGLFETVVKTFWKITDILSISPAQCTAVIKLNKLFKDYDNTRGKDFGYSDRPEKGKRKRRL